MLSRLSQKPRSAGHPDFQSHNFTFSYDALSRRTQLTRPNGVNTNYSYDNVSRLLSVLHQVGSTTVDGASYTYDSAGNRTAKTDQASSVTSNYGYDAIYQLTGVSQGSTTTESYTYDTVGNRLSSLGVSPYAYNSSNQLTSTPSTTYTYDSNGSTKTKVDSSGTTTYNWDYVNQLSSVVLPASGGTVSFKYDPFGRRIQKSGPSGTTNYLYDGRDLLEEVDSSGNVLARYTQFPSIDQPLAELRSGVTSYYEQDGIGSVSALSNSAGALANTYTYDAFGKLTASTGTLVNPFQYTGREFDQETGIYQYRYRYYDSSVGRFTSEDPYGFRGGANFYRYVFNSPTNLVDPWGLAPNCVMTSAGLQCDSSALDYQMAALNALFPSTTPQGGSMTIPMSCDQVNKILADSGYYTGGPFSHGNWMTQNPFLFWSPFHWGGSEWRNRSGFHFRRKYTLCDKSCTLYEFHIDEHNPMYDPWGHATNDIPKALGLGQ
jgi:RHS repeat-associated protein